MKAVIQWVLRTMMKDQTGIVKTMPKKDLVDFNVAMTAERLMRNGIDPNSLKNANQVENAINQIEAPRNVQQGIKSTKSAKVFDLEGKEIDPKKGIMGGKQIPDDDLPPPGSRGGKDDIAAPIQSEDEILEKLNRENKEARRNLQIKLSKDKGYQKFKGETEEEIRKRFGLDDPEDMATGGRAGFKDGLTPSFEEYMRERQGMEQKRNLEQMYKEYLEDMRRKKVMEQKQMVAEGGRIGFKDGMTRRTFLKLLGGMAAVPIVGKFFKLAKVGKTMKEVPMIKTDDVAGKPEWFDALVNKVIREGDDVTKKFATGERQSIHQKTLDDGSVVRVTEDVDDGAVRVEYESDKNVFEDPVQLQYRKPKPDEGDPRPTAEFTTAESGPVGRSYGPDDYEIDVDEVGGTSIRDLDSDVSKLKEYATGQKPTMKEFIQNKKRRDKARAITEDPEAQSDAVIRRQGEAQDYDYEDKFASGGIARLLGE